jgi:hypothetical protein
MVVMLTVEGAINLVNKHTRYDETQYAESYGEPGYTNPERGILFANWNDVPGYIQEGLERRGFDLEWSDEWIIATSSWPCKAYRASPDCYSWTPYYVLTDDGEVVGGDEIEEDPDWYVNEYLLNDPTHCNVFKIDFAKLGFKRVSEDDFESGWHPGQTDDPNAVFNRLREELPDHDLVFDLTEQSQFYTKWNIWSRPQN